ncbi:lectin-like domain-containing protein [Parvibium lacunae]|uniref:DUF1929 domain-containing protein n=1 Tax=Parvibium lacunae TaxID=1888893 RepID=A0A368L6T5_9BURK|nr:galactose oxidase-like domain-containing protein [Parvibium lacunae]RCS59380.1 DUF1929 domain-containing protein [Parvibium lacunae]
MGSISAVSRALPSFDAFCRARCARLSGLVASIFSIALVGCGGGDKTVAQLTGASDSSSQAAIQAIRSTEKHIAGAWDPVFDMSLIPIHMVLQPDGRVMYYGSDLNGSQTAAYRYGIWNPANGTSSNSLMILPNGTGNDLFCSSQTVLLDGKTLIVGGDEANPDSNVANRSTNLFSFLDNSLVKQNDLNRLRWYSSTTMLLNGEVYIQGGSGGHDRPEVRQTDGTYRLLNGVDTSAYDATFPKNWLAPDGRVFGVVGNGYMYYVNPTGNGALTAAGQLPAANAGAATGAAMFRPGRILKLSTNSPAAAIIDINNGQAAVTNTEAVSSIRIHSVATVLADGRVLVSGGSSTDNVLNTANNAAEVWDPVSGQWTIGPAQQLARLYHGTALLLPDARVLVAGGGAPGPLTNKNGEIYTPSYLYNSQGALAPRPTITTAPTVVEPGQSFNIETSTANLSRVSLVRFGSVSHSWNSDQRFIDLPWRNNGSQRFALQMPARAADTPPGFYMLFAFDTQGVPSVAKILRVNMPGARDAARSPAVNNIANQRSDTGAVIDIQPTASNPLGRTLRWSASGLPNGLVIDANTGKITGSPRQPGTFFATVAVDDGSWVGSSSFLWEVAQGTLVLQPVLPVSAALSQQDLTFTANAIGSNVRYQWNFGDGSPVSAWSTSRTIRYRYSAPGVYAVTVTAIDDQGRPQTQTFLQTVALTATPTRPARSSALLFEQPSTGNARLWVANPDANTVSVFDAVTQNKLAEIVVGQQPVTLTRDATGQIWVANRQSDSLSIINPTSLTVSQTMNLASGSGPYGILATPNNPNLIHVVLEGRGQLLRIDAAKRLVGQTVNLGSQPRHLAITHNGSKLYVSRFITPPLPGEATATVQPNAGGVARGGEVVVLNANLAITKTMILRHSDKVDSENQGRGIPNYLGAMAISPDGSQAFVPSKQDNILRGTLRDGSNLNFQSTVRAISSRILLASEAEDLAGRIDHDNASLASAAAFDPRGVWLFVALETSREIAILNAHNRTQLLRIETDFAPQALEVSPDGKRLYVSNFMARNVGVYDLVPLLEQGRLVAPLLQTLPTVGNELLPPQVLRGKQLFYDARDPRLARDRYMSCATCHNDGGHDGRTWDLTGMGEGLRNTISLRGRAGMTHGRLHWTGNFDEVQDFEGQIRGLAGGTGLMPDAAFNTGTRSQPLGDKKAGLSSDLDALAAYLGSLTQFGSSPLRAANGQLSSDALIGRNLFNAQCIQCHSGSIATDSPSGKLHKLATIKASSGKRLGSTLTGLDTPTLRDVWATAPYLHDGSAATLEAAIQAHQTGLDATKLRQLASYLREGGLDMLPSAVQLGASNLSLVGAAAVRADGAIQITPNSTAQGGAAWSTLGWSTTQAFTTSFDFVLQGAARQADGIALVMHGSGNNFLGGLGGCIGVCNLPNWSGLVIQTWENNRVGLATNTQIAKPAGFDLGNAANISGRATLAYNPVTKLLTSYVTLTSNGVSRTLVDAMTIDLTAKFGQRVTVGITGATGGASAEQVIRNWTADFAEPINNSWVKLNWDAQAQTNGSLLLTPNTQNKTGTAWATQPLSSSQSFTTELDFSLRGTARQADGLALVLQNTGTDFVGMNGGCLGVCNLPNWIGAVVQTWDNNRLGFASNAQAAKSAGVDLGNHALIQGHLIVRYDASRKLLEMTGTLVTDGVVRPINDTLSIDLSARFGPRFFIGVGAATGGAAAEQIVSQWVIRQR